MIRKIKSREEIEKARKRNIAIISFFMLFLLVVSTAGYALIVGGNFGSSNDNNQADIEYWLPLGSSLEEIKDIPVNIYFSLENYKNFPVYISANNSRVFSGIYSIIGKYASRVNEACYKECEEDLPEKDCSENFIVYKESEENIVYQLDRCIFIEGNLKTVDAFLYRIAGGE